MTQKPQKGGQTSERLQKGGPGEWTIAIDDGWCCHKYGIGRPKNLSVDDMARLIREYSRLWNKEAKL